MTDMGYLVTVDWNEGQMVEATLEKKLVDDLGIEHALASLDPGLEVEVSGRMKRVSKVVIGPSGGGVDVGVFTFEARWTPVILRNADAKLIAGSSLKGYGKNLGTAFLYKSREDAKRQVELIQKKK